MTKTITVSHLINWQGFPDLKYSLTIGITAHINVDSYLLLVGAYGISTSTKPYNWDGSGNPIYPVPATDPFMLIRGLDVDELTEYEKMPDPITETLKGFFYQYRNFNAVGFYDSFDDAYQALVAASSVIQRHVSEEGLIALEILYEHDTLAIQSAEQLYAYGGIPPYVWSISINNSGGIINQDGLYIPGLTPGDDIIALTDSDGIVATHLFTVCLPTEIDYDKTYETDKIVDPRPSSYGDPCV